MPIVQITDGSSFEILAWGTRDKCRTLEFLTELEHRDRNEFEKMMSLLDWTANHGPPKNREKFRNLGDEIYEFKTTRIRLLCFFQPGRLIVCTHGVAKPKKRELTKEKKVAVSIRGEYLKEMEGTR